MFDRLFKVALLVALIWLAAVMTYSAGNNRYRNISGASSELNILDTRTGEIYVVTENGSVVAVDLVNGKKKTISVPRAAAATTP